MSEQRAQGPSPEDMHDSARLQFDKVHEAHSTVAGLRGAMDRLRKLGDMVQPDDVIGEAGKLMGHSNLSSVEIAKFLSTMPAEGGQPLLGWLTQHEQGLMQMEHSTRRALDVARHRMGVAALQELSAHSLRQSAQRAQQAPPQRLGSTLAITTPSTLSGEGQ